MTMKKHLAVLTIVAFAVGGFVPTAHAGLSMMLDDGTTQTTVQDNVGLDINPAVGVITFSGSLAGWGINVTTGLGDSVLGTLSEKKLDLNSVNVGGAGTLTIMLTETDLSLSLLPQGRAGVLRSLIGGTTNGTVQLTQILDRSNTAFADSEQGYHVVADSGLLGPGAFSSTQIVAVPELGPSLFSLTEKVIITHERAGITSFDAGSSVVPVPGAVLLGFLGLSAAGLKLRRFA